MPSNYEIVDDLINDWAKRHALKLNTSFSGREARYAYCSSIAGECFQISIDPPSVGAVSVCSWCVEGRREDDPPRYWRSAPAELGSALEKAYQTVEEWMAPSERLFPKLKS